MKGMKEGGPPAHTCTHLPVCAALMIGVGRDTRLDTYPAIPIKVRLSRTLFELGNDLMNAQLRCVAGELYYQC